MIAVSEGGNHEESEQGGVEKDNRETKFENFPVDLKVNHGNNDYVIITHLGVLLGILNQYESHQRHEEREEHCAVVDVKSDDVEGVQVSVRLNTGTPACEHSSGWETEMKKIQKEEEQVLQNELADFQGSYHSHHENRNCDSEEQMHVDVFLFHREHQLDTNPEDNEQCDGHVEQRKQ